MRQLFPWTKRAHRRREAWADAAYEQRTEYEQAVDRLHDCDDCPPALSVNGQEQVEGLRR